jgi:hypothetical protein
MRSFTVVDDDVSTIKQQQPRGPRRSCSSHMTGSTFPRKKNSRAVLVATTFVVLASIVLCQLCHNTKNGIVFTLMTVNASTIMSTVPINTRNDECKNPHTIRPTKRSPIPFVQFTRRFLQQQQQQQNIQSHNTMMSPAERDNFIHHISRRGQATLTHSIPALSVYYCKQRRNHKKGKFNTKKFNLARELDSDFKTFQLMEVAVKEKQQQRRPRRQRPVTSTATSDPSPRSLPNPIEITTQFLDHAGFYYGIDLKSISQDNTNINQKRRRRRRPPRQPKLQDSMVEALAELKILRQEMEKMRQEVHILKLKMIGEEEEEEEEQQQQLQRLDALPSDSDEVQYRQRRKLRKKQKEAERLAVDIESWAQKLLQEGENEGWKPIECNKMVRGSLNEGERTSAYIKWMKDSRLDQANPEDDSEYPCIKCYSVIDAPLEDVCTYLSQETASADYNDVVEKHQDIEEISPSAKICWSQSPQILFIKPRDFVTFCHHRWKKDGTEVIVNQACEHPDFPREKLEKEGKSCRGYALRGANCKSI